MVRFSVLLDFLKLISRSGRSYRLSQFRNGFLKTLARILICCGKRAVDVGGEGSVTWSDGFK